MSVVPTLAIRGGSVDVLIEGERIAAAVSGSTAGATLDATGCRVFPGFVDLQCNGGFGVDFTTSPEDAHVVAARLPETGVTSFLPTIITAPKDVMLRAVTELDVLRGSSPGARSLGVHVEGPFINALRGGAHPLRYIRPPDIAEANRWTASGNVAMVTLAPELDKALDVVAVLSSAGVVVSCGHCDMSVAELDDAIAAGATAATHLYNAMGSMSARSPGSAGAVLANGSLMAGIIADGLHVSPEMIAIAWHSLGPERLFLVTDAIAALGLPHGPFRVGDTVVHVDEDGPRTVRGVLAGSVLRMDEAVRNLIAFTGCSTADAVAAATTNPARLLGRSDVGALQPGAYGDVVLLDGDNRVAATVVGGRVLFDPLQRLAN